MWWGWIRRSRAQKRSERLEGLRKSSGETNGWIKGGKIEQDQKEERRKQKWNKRRVQETKKVTWKMRKWRWRREHDTKRGRQEKRKTMKRKTARGEEVRRLTHASHSIITFISTSAPNWGRGGRRSSRHSLISRSINIHQTYIIPLRPAVPVLTSNVVLKPTWKSGPMSAPASCYSVLELFHLSSKTHCGWWSYEPKVTNRIVLYV